MGFTCQKKRGLMLSMCFRYGIQRQSFHTKRLSTYWEPRNVNPCAFLLRLNVAGLTKQGVRVHTIKKDLFEMGLSEAASPVGHTLRSYDMERTICDLVRSRRCIEAQTLQGAVKGYARSKTKNTPRLMRYAKALSIESVIRQYMEVLL